MSKRIVMLCDGTWETAKGDTNIYKLFKALAAGPDQVVFYDDGVGANGLEIEHLIGGAMGIGLFEKIKTGYTNIAHVFEPGDDIYLFGFSRGAYTARSIAGMIAAVGLPIESFAFDSSRLDAAWDAYRDKAKLKEWEEAHSLPCTGTAKPDWQLDVKIKMVGVFDTVGSLGLPAIAGGVDPLVFGFLDTDLHPDIENAFHALAIDERRREFPPTLWGNANPQQRLQQVWFAGVHGDVGGGYADPPPPGYGATSAPGLADIPLNWMANRARECGLTFSTDLGKELLDPKFALALAHESWSLFPWGFPKSREIPDGSSIANSVLVRESEGDAYCPDLPQDWTQVPVVNEPKED